MTGIGAGRSAASAAGDRCVPGHLRAAVRGVAPGLSGGATQALSRDAGAARSRAHRRVRSGGWRAAAFAFPFPAWGPPAPGSRGRGRPLGEPGGVVLDDDLAELDA